MISEKIMNYLRPITDEEKRLKSEENSIDKSIYMTNTDCDIIQGKRLLKERLITIRPHTRFVHFPKHSHDYVEVVYMCSGSTTHIINDTKIVLKERELLFLSQHTEHEILPASETDVAVNFIIMPQFLDIAAAMLGGFQSPLKSFLIDCLGSRISGNRYLYFQVADCLPVQNLVENLLYALISDNENSFLNRYTMGLLFLQLLEQTDRLAYAQHNDATILKVMQYIESNYRDGSLSELARSIHCDFYWLSREIKRRTGKTYTDLVQEKRLSQAVFLLANTDMNVSEISSEVGYENAGYFYKIFADKYGLSPMKFRKSSNIN